ncbi:hypothetical protein [Peribacillus sp. Hz7]|uniref:hypothetical protein n=1 Tax=Peribacillus sp. Hz7 TaxID=3344873 RepID=UPI0035CA8CE0
MGDKKLKNKFIKSIRNYILYIVNHDFSVELTSIEFIYELKNLHDEWSMPDKTFSNGLLQEYKTKIMVMFNQLTSIVDSPYYFSYSANNQFFAAYKRS